MVTSHATVLTSQPVKQVWFMSDNINHNGWHPTIDSTLCQSDVHVDPQASAVQDVGCMPTASMKCVLFCCSQAAKLIMLGFQMVPIPPVQEVIDLITEDTYGYREWSHHLTMHQLGFDQIMWILDVAKFKTCYRMVSSSQKPNASTTNLTY